MLKKRGSVKIFYKREFLAVSQKCLLYIETIRDALHFFDVRRYSIFQLFRTEKDFLDK